METNNTQTNENEITIENHFNEIKMEIKEEDISYDLNQSMNENQINQSQSNENQPNENQSNENQTNEIQTNRNQAGAMNGLFYVINTVPVVNASPTNFLIIQYPAIKVDTANPVTFTIDAPTIPQSQQFNYYPINSTIRSNFTQNNQRPKPNQTYATNNISNGRNHYNSASTKEPIRATRNLGAPINQIPRDVLGDYGIVMEGSERHSAEPNRYPTEPDNFEPEDEFEDTDIETEEEQDPETGDESDNEAPKKKKQTKTSSSSSGACCGFSNAGHHLIISSVMSLQKKKYRKCKICDAEFLTGFDLMEHQAKHCTFKGCPEVIEDDAERKKHEKFHRDHPHRPFKCDHCRRCFFYYKFTCKHKGVCQYLEKGQCPYCQYASSVVRHLRKHVARHVNTVTCPDCQKKYVALKKFIEHMEVKHQKRVAFKCTECPRRFQFSDTLINHIYDHGLLISEVGISRFIMFLKARKA